MGDFDDLRAKIKALAKEIQTLGTKYNINSERAVAQVKDVFDELTYMERAVSEQPTEKEPSWMD